MKLIKLSPFIANYIWGGHRLCDIYGADASEPAAEAWVFSAHPDGQSLTAEGEPFGSWLKQNPDALGTDARVSDGFGAPILCKFIDAENSLSIQVHPDDDFAEKHENSPGKTELWYILDAKPGAYIYYGLKEDTTEDKLREAMSNGSITELLNRVCVQKGDAYFIPAGTVHAIGAGIFVCEIQQSSNITYRMYDYGRLGADGRPRALHTEKAAACALKTASSAEAEKGDVLAECEYFKSVRYSLKEGEKVKLNVGEESFASVIAVSGGGTISAGEERSKIAFGNSFFVPAGSGEILLSADSSLEVIVSQAGEGK
ncbi:MAG: class I mannose-6-phosphate isomerase [Oscillospiraceae bacterium]|nr:class I mannose-6-phosphate isomerase [Oscillospiraceae bacterium]